MIDASLLVTSIVIVVAAIAASVLRTVHKERCLNDLDGFRVVVRLDDDRAAWGAMSLHSTGFELAYDTDVRDEQVHSETSYVFYKDEYARLQAIMRFADDLTPENHQARDRALQRTFHPSLWQLLVRGLRNFANTAIDALSEVLNLLLGRSKVVTNQLVLAQGQTQIKGLTRDILGYVGTSYDPLLESFVGSQVVIRLSDGDASYEFSGVLKDYSTTFLEILNVYALQAVEQPAGADSKSGMVYLDDHSLVIHNCLTCSLRIDSLLIDRNELLVDQIVEPGKRAVIPISDPTQEIVARMLLVRRLDLVLPRGHTLLRHRAERYYPGDAFDLPREWDLLWQRGESPSDKTHLLLEKGRATDADCWLTQPLALRRNVCAADTEE